MTFFPERSDQGSLLFAVDHCFSIRGQGTVMTGTILQGAISVNDVSSKNNMIWDFFSNEIFSQNIEISALKEIRKVKSIQMFKKSVSKAIQGDRVGVCVTQFDSGLLERGLVATPGSEKVVLFPNINQKVTFSWRSLPNAFAIVIKLNRIPYFKGKISTKGKFHIW